MSQNPYQQSPSNSLLPKRPSKDVAIERVKMPATLMIVNSVISILSSIGNGGFLAFVYLGMQDEILEEIEKQPPNPDVTPEMMELMVNLMGGGGVAFAIVGVVVGVIMIAGAMGMMKLKGWTLALFAAILSLIPCFQGCCLFSIPVGIYALVVLMDSDVKSAFD